MRKYIFLYVHSKISNIIVAFCSISVDIHTDALTANIDNNDVDTQKITINPDNILFYEDDVQMRGKHKKGLALLPIPKKHKLDKNAQAVKLPQKNKDYIYETAVATGISNSKLNYILYALCQNSIL